MDGLELRPLQDVALERLHEGVALARGNAQRDELQRDGEEGAVEGRHRAGTQSALEMCRVLAARLEKNLKKKKGERNQ